MRHQFILSIFATILFTAVTSQASTAVNDKFSFNGKCESELEQAEFKKDNKSAIHFLSQDLSDLDQQIKIINNSKEKSDLRADLLDVSERVRASAKLELADLTKEDSALAKKLNEACSLSKISSPIEWDLDLVEEILVGDAK